MSTEKIVMETVTTCIQRNCTQEFDEIRERLKRELSSESKDEIIEMKRAIDSLKSNNRKMKLKMKVRIKSIYDKMEV